MTGPARCGLNIMSVVGRGCSASSTVGVYVEAYDNNPAGESFQLVSFHMAPVPSVTVQSTHRTKAGNLVNLPFAH